MKRNKILIFGFVFAAVIAGFYFVSVSEKKTPTASSDKKELIVVDKPQPNEVISSPFIVSGKARGFWFFEASFPIEVLDEEGEIISTAIAEAQSDWMTTDFVLFKATIEFPPSLREKGTLVFKKDNPSGLPENDDEARIPVIFGGGAEIIKVKIFLNNSRLDPEFSCNKVFPVEREIPKTEGVARAAIEELLRGPTDKEKSEDFLTNINQGVKIKKLVIEDGIAKIDFDEQLEFQVGGSCRVSAIRAQITETLKQFKTVKDVVISVDGRTEDILQP